MLNINFGGWIGTLLVATAGAVLLLFLLGLFTGRRRAL
jgi:uncharacterized membrane protein YeaQ/YmgE (transglycosylase-associated protein family)